MPPRGRVVWKKQDGDRARRELRTHPLLPLEHHDSENYQAVLPHLYVGSLWIATEHLMIDTRFTAQVGGYKQHEHKYLIQCYTALYQTPEVPVGKCLIYVGPVRVEEANVKGEKLRVARHAFLVDGVVYMVLHPETVLTPVQAQEES